MTLKSLINKNTALVFISIILSSTLLFTISLSSSSVRSYLIENTNNYHVSMKIDNISYKHIKDSYKKDGITYITYDDITKTYEYTDKICSNLKCTNITYNTKLLTLYGVGNNSILKILVITLFILSFGCIIFIYNIFDAWTIQKNKEIIQLRSIGMTKSQTFIMLLKEGIIILFISIIIGFIISLWLTSILVNIISYLLKDLLTLKVSISIPFILIPTLFITFISLLCFIIPVIICIKGKTTETKRVKIPKRYKALTKLAYSNYKRCRKKYRPITLSIFITSVLFSTFSLYLSYGLESLNYLNIPSYNYKVISTKKIDLSSKSKKICFIEGSINKEDYLDTSYYKKNKTAVIVEDKNEKVVNQISGDYMNTTYLKNKVTINNKTYKTTSDIPKGTEEYLTSDYIILTTDNIDNYCDDYLYLYTIDKKIDNFEDKINNEEKELTYINYEKARNLADNLILTIKIVLYTLVVFVTLIGIISMINVGRCTVNIRRDEIMILKGIGLTDKNLFKLLKKECFYVIRKAFIITIPFMILISYILYISTNEIIDVEFIYPIKQIIICLCVSYIILYLTLKREYKSIKCIDLKQI